MKRHRATGTDDAAHLDRAATIRRHPAAEVELTTGLEGDAGVEIDPVDGLGVAVTHSCADHLTAGEQVTHDFHMAVGAQYQGAGKRIVSRVGAHAATDGDTTGRGNLDADPVVAFILRHAGQHLGATGGGYTRGDAYLLVERFDVDMVVRRGKDEAIGADLSPGQNNALNPHGLRTEQLNAAAYAGGGQFAGLGDEHAHAVGIGAMAVDQVDATAKHAAMNTEIAFNRGFTFDIHPFIGLQ